jgi:hypothetical protein
MCTALGIFKSRVSAGLPCLWIRFVEVSATCASRSKGYNICTKLRWFSISTKFAGGYMLCWSLLDECWVEKKFFIRAVVCSRSAFCLCCAMILLSNWTRLSEQKMFILQCQFLTPSLLQVQCLERTLNTALPVKQVRQPSSSVIMNCPSMDVNVRDPRLQSCAVAHPHQQEEGNGK